MQKSPKALSRLLTVNSYCHMFVTVILSFPDFHTRAIIWYHGTRLQYKHRKCLFKNGNHTFLHATKGEWTQHVFQQGTVEGKPYLRNQTKKSSDLVTLVMKIFGLADKGLCRQRIPGSFCGSQKTGLDRIRETVKSCTSSQCTFQNDSEIRWSLVWFKEGPQDAVLDVWQSSLTQYNWSEVYPCCFMTQLFKFLSNILHCVSACTN